MWNGEGKEVRYAMFYQIQEIEGGQGKKIFFLHTLFAYEISSL